MQQKKAAAKSAQKKPVRKTAQKARRADSRSGAATYTALILDGEFRVRTYGDAAVDLFGFEENAILGEHVTRLLPTLDLRLNKVAADSNDPIVFRDARMDAMRANGDAIQVVVGMRQDSVYGNSRHVILVRRDNFDQPHS